MLILILSVQRLILIFKTLTISHRYFAELVGN